MYTGGTDAGAFSKKVVSRSPVFGQWFPEDGTVTVDIDAIGANSTFRLGSKNVLKKVLGKTSLYASVRADAKSGPTKTVYVSDLPPTRSAAVSKLSSRLSQTREFIQAGEIMLAHAFLQASAAVQEGVARFTQRLGAERLDTGELSVDEPGTAAIQRTLVSRMGRRILRTFGSSMYLAEASAEDLQKLGLGDLNGVHVSKLLQFMLDDNFASLRLGSTMLLGAVKPNTEPFSGLPVVFSDDSADSGAENDGTVTPRSSPRSGRAARGSTAGGGGGRNAMCTQDPATDAGMPETLWVQVVSAVHLPAADHGGKSDPFAELGLVSGVTEIHERQLAAVHGYHPSDRAAHKKRITKEHAARNKDMKARAKAGETVKANSKLYEQVYKTEYIPDTCSPVWGEQTRFNLRNLLQTTIEAGGSGAASGFERYEVSQLVAAQQRGGAAAMEADTAPAEQGHIVSDTNASLQSVDGVTVPLSVLTSGYHNAAKVDEESSFLSVTLFDHDKTSRNDVLGRVSVCLNTLPPNMLVDVWLPLQTAAKSHHKASGSVRLRLMRTADLGIMQKLQSVQVIADKLRESLVVKASIAKRLEELQTASRSRALADGSSEEDIVASVDSASEEEDLTPEEADGSAAAAASKPPTERGTDNGREHAASDVVTEATLEAAQTAPKAATTHLPPAAADAEAVRAATKPPVKSAKSSSPRLQDRVIGQQLEVVCLELRNLRAAPGHQFYGTASVDNVFRRTDVSSCGSSVTVAFHRSPLGVAVSRTRSAGPQGMASRPLVVHDLSRDALVASLALPRGGTVLPKTASPAVSLACLRRGLRVTAINGERVTGTTYTNAQNVLINHVNAFKARFEKSAVLAAAAPLTMTFEFPSETEDTGDSDSAQTEETTERKLVWGNILQFGDRIPYVVPNPADQAEVASKLSSREKKVTAGLEEMRRRYKRLQFCLFQSSSPESHRNILGGERVSSAEESADVDIADEDRLRQLRNDTQALKYFFAEEKSMLRDAAVYVYKHVHDRR